MSKYWKNIGNNKYGKSCYALYFTQFDEDENDDKILAVIVQDNDISGYYHYVSREMNVEDDDLMAENIEDAKIQIEEKLIEFWEDEIAEIEDKIEKFKEG